MKHEPCTVIVTVDAPLERMPQLVSHARLGIERFPEFTGFQSGALHVSRDGGRLVQYLVWASEAEYDACMTDPVWDTLPSTRAFMGSVALPDVFLDARIYRVDRSSGRIVIGTG